MDEDKQIDKIQIVDIGEEMKTSYIAYSMSVIVSRALPDVRDGLKPVHRRILHAMNDLHLDATKPYRKSATIVGETMGKYHPHGDSSIYDAMVRLAQPFSTRYMLVDGHGNFGSIDGDDPAAMRYTEARLSRIAMEMLADIEKNTVDFVPNYDENEKEPSVLPSRIPNLLVNGSSGIAVGMATNIPPHNLSETIDAVVKMIDNHVIEDRDTDIEELLQIVKGPDFPTAGTICGTTGIREAYLTGRGKVSVRAVSNVEPIPGASGRDMIVVSEIPYQVNKAKLIEKIAELVKDKRVEGISDLRDETNRTGMRVVIELKKDVNPDVILNQLYKYTQLQDSFGIIMLALVDGEPKVLNLKQILTYYLNHQKEVVTRRTQFELDKAQRRAHILEGLIIAIDNIDEVIRIVRSSKDRPTARERLMERFQLSEEQAQAIVNMTIGSLTGLEREKVETEYRELKELIGELQAILADEKRLYGVIREEILIVKAKYGDERRTKITFDATDINIEDLIKEETNVITMTHLNYIKRLPVTTYRSQNRGGKGVIGMQTREEDLVKNLFLSSTHDYILFFTSKGRVYRIKAYEIPESGRQSRGIAIVNLLDLSQGEDITAVIPVRDYEEGSYLVMVTEKGVVKKTSMMDYANIRKSGLNAIHLRENDTLISVKVTHGDNTVLIATRKGYGIHFHEQCVRPMGRTATGVRGIKLRGGDVVTGMEITNVGKNVLIVTENGYGKCTDPTQLTLQNRGGMGLKIHKVTEKTGNIVGIRMVDEQEDIMLVTSDGIVIRIKVRQISVMGRITQGVKLMNFSKEVQIVGLANVLEEDTEDEAAEEGLSEEELTSEEDQEPEKEE